MNTSMLIAYTKVTNKNTIASTAANALPNVHAISLYMTSVGFDPHYNRLLEDNDDTVRHIALVTDDITQEDSDKIDMLVFSPLLSKDTMHKRSTEIMLQLGRCLAVKRGKDEFSAEEIKAAPEVFVRQHNILSINKCGYDTIDDAIEFLNKN